MFSPQKAIPARAIPESNSNRGIGFVARFESNSRPSWNWCLKKRGIQGLARNSTIPRFVSYREIRGARIAPRVLCFICSPPPGIPTMNKQQIYDAMGGRISMASINEYSGEFVITGKYGIVSWMDDYWDIWITAIHHEKELTSRKVFYLCTAVKPLVKTLDTELTCEAIGMCTSADAAYQIAAILGARKRRNSSSKQLANLRNVAQLADEILPMKGHHHL